MEGLGDVHDALWRSSATRIQSIVSGKGLLECLVNITSSRFQRLVRRALALMLEGVPRIGEEDVRDGDTLRRSVWALHFLVALESTQITTPKVPLGSLLHF